MQLEEAGVWVDAYGRAFNKKQSYPGSAYLAFVRKAMTRVLRSSCEQVEIVKGDSGDGSSHDENRGLFLSRDSAQPWKVRYLVSAFASGKTTTYDINGLYVRSAMGGGEHRNTQTVISNLNAIDVLTSIKQDWENEQRAEHLKCVHGNKLLRLKFPTRDNDDENVFALWDDAGVEDDDECDDSSVDADSSSAASSPATSPRSSGGFVVVQKDLSMNVIDDASPPFKPLRRPSKATPPISIRNAVQSANASSAVAISTSPIVAPLSHSPTSPMGMALPSPSPTDSFMMAHLSLSGSSGKGSKKKSKKKLQREEKMRRRAELKAKRRAFVSKKAQKKAKENSDTQACAMTPVAADKNMQKGAALARTPPSACAKDEKLGRRAARKLRRKKMDERLAIGKAVARRHRSDSEDDDSLSSASADEDDAVKIQGTLACQFIAFDGNHVLKIDNSAAAAVGGLDAPARFFAVLSDGSHGIVNAVKKNSVEMGVEALKKRWREGRECPSCVAFLKSGRILTGYPTGAVAVWSASGQYESTFAVGEGSHGVVRMATRSDSIVVVDAGGNVSSWKEVEHGGMKRLNKMRSPMLNYCAALVITEYYVVAANNIGAMYVWHRKTGRFVEKYQPHVGAIGCIDFAESHLSTNRKSGSSFVRVITGGIDDGDVALTKIRAPKLNKWGGLLPAKPNSNSPANERRKDIKILRGHGGPVRCVHIDVHKAVSCSDDGSIKIWDLQHGHKGRVIRTLRLKGRRVPIVSLAVGARIIVGGAADGTVNAFFFNSAFDPRTSTCKRRKSFQGEYWKRSALVKKRTSVNVSPFTPLGGSTSRSDRRSLRDLKAWCNRTEIIDDYDDGDSAADQLSPAPSPERRRYDRGE